MQKRGNTVFQYDKNGTFISKFLSSGDASRKTGISKSCIKNCCNKKNKTAGCFIFRYEKDGYEYLQPLPLDERIKEYTIASFSKQGILIKNITI